MLFNLAPKILDDPEGLTVTGVPERTQQLTWFEHRGIPYKKIVDVIDEYPSFKISLFLLQELFHKHGKRFETTSSFLEAFRNVQKVDGLLGACIVSFNFCPCKNEFVHEMDSLLMLVSKLKSKSSKLSIAEWLAHILCIEESLDLICKLRLPAKHGPYV